MQISLKLCYYMNTQPSSNVVNRFFYNFQVLLKSKRWRLMILIML